MSAKKPQKGDGPPESRTGFNQSYSPQMTTGPGYSPKSSALPRRVVPMDEPKHGGGWRWIVGALVLALLAAGVAWQTKPGRRALKRLGETIEARLLR